MTSGKYAKTNRALNFVYFCYAIRKIFFALALWHIVIVKLFEIKLRKNTITALKADSTVAPNPLSIKTNVNLVC